MSLKNIHGHSINLLNFVYIVVFDIGKEYQISNYRATRIVNLLHPLQIPLGGILQKSKCHLCT